MAVDNREKVRSVSTDKYTNEVRQRWGNTEAYKESLQRNADTDKAVKALDAVLGGFAGLHRNGTAPDDEPAKIQVEKLRQCITDNFYTCTDEILAGLGEMYTADERFKNNIDKHGEGTAEFISACIRSY